MSFAIRLVMASILIEGWGLNSISNSPSSIAHFKNFLETSGFQNIWLSG